MKTKENARLAQDINPSNQNCQSIYDVSLKQLTGDFLDLSKFRGSYILFVNVASKCGFTKQYSDLQKLSEEYADNLVVIGSPCNQFGGQEPGKASEIETFCQVNYGVTFPITEKLKVKGSNQHPLYEWLTSKALNGKKNSSVKWNFQKYLVSPEGQLVNYYYSLTKPLSKKITKHLKD